MTGPLVAVCGSINVDLVGYAERLPRAGETVLGTKFQRHMGGKGANQATAARRYGVRVHMVGAVGDDGLGRLALAALTASGVDIADVIISPDAATGVALISVDSDGENQILVLPGANAHVEPPRPCGADVWLCQGETSAETLAATLKAARSDSALAICNASPTEGLAPDVIGAFDLVIVNEAEYEALRDMLPERVVVTAGSRGAYIHPEELHVPAHPATVVDTTGAGDAFAGVLAAALAEGSDLADAAQTAAIAAAISVESAGAQSSYPERAMIDAVVSDERSALHL